MKGKKYNLLFVEDDINLGFVVKDQLEQVGYNVSWAINGKDGLNMALQKQFDIAVLDVMLPIMDGFTLAEELIQLNPDLPFLFLTAKSLLEDKLKGLKLGKDYITKPFEFKELELRLENIMLQTTPNFHKEEESCFTLGKYTFDYVNQYLKLNDKEQKLTQKEADVLKLLCIHQNTVMNREHALKTIWGSDNYFNGRSMDVFISKIRKYLKGDPNIQIINVHGVGFKMAIRD